MSYSRLLERAWQRNLPVSAILELTYRCNLDCFFCYNDLALRGRPLSREQYYRLFADLRDLGTQNLTLTGGEPLAHPDFFLLGARARELGFLVRVKTNGHALRPRLAARLKREVDPFSLDVSLHGATAEVHDRQTRVPGSFQQLSENLQTLLAEGLRVRLKIPLTAWNEHQLDELLLFADRLGLTPEFDVQITPRDDGDHEPLSIAPSPAAIAEMLRRLEERRPMAVQQTAGPAPTVDRPPKEKGEAGKKHCGAGSVGLTIDPYGNVMPCVQWRRWLGNLHERPIAEIWNHSPAVAEVRRTAEAVRGFVASQGAGCEDMGYCPGLAEQLMGSPLRMYPAATLRKTLAAKNTAVPPQTPGS